MRLPPLSDMRCVKAKKPTETRRKLVEFDAPTWHALNLLSRESRKRVQKLCAAGRHPASARRAARAAASTASSSESERRMGGMGGVLRLRAGNFRAIVVPLPSVRLTPRPSLARTGRGTV
jgi:hypothetical protein